MVTLYVQGRPGDDDEWDDDFDEDDDEPLNGDFDDDDDFDDEDDDLENDEDDEDDEDEDGRWNAPFSHQSRKHGIRVKPSGCREADPILHAFEQR